MRYHNTAMTQKPKKRKGGARPGAGRPKGSSTAQKIAVLLQTACKGLTPLEFLCSVYRNDEIALPFRIGAAIAAARYCHTPLSPQRALEEGDGDITINVVRYSEADFEGSEAGFPGRQVESDRVSEEVTRITAPPRSRSAPED